MNLLPLDLLSCRFHFILLTFHQRNTLTWESVLCLVPIDILTRNNCRYMGMKWDWKQEERKRERERETSEKRKFNWLEWRTRQSNWVEKIRTCTVFVSYVICLNYAQRPMPDTRQFSAEQRCCQKPHTPHLSADIFFFFISVLLPVFSWFRCVNASSKRIFE